MAGILEVVLAAERATAADMFAAVVHVGTGFAVRKVSEPVVKQNVDFAMASLVFGTAVGQFVVCDRSADFQLSDVLGTGFAQIVV